MDIVAGEAGDAATIHHALNEVVALHAIFVRGAVGKMSETRLAQRVFLELPEIAKILADAISDGPIVVLAFDGIRRGACPGNGTGCRCHWPGRSPDERD